MCKHDNNNDFSIVHCFKTNILKKNVEVKCKNAYLLLKRNQHITLTTIVF